MLYVSNKIIDILIQNQQYCKVKHKNNKNRVKKTLNNDHKKKKIFLKTTLIVLYQLYFETYGVK